MVSGDYADAALIYERLARTASDLELRQAPHLYLQTARACLLAGRSEPADNLLRQGLDLLAESGRWVAFDRIGRRIVAELTSLGYPAQAEALQAWLGQRLQTAPAFAVSAAAYPTGAHRSSLPPQCPACGAPLRPDEVEWLAEDRAECAYCGSVVPG
jgi:hypothetical protein